MATLINGNGNPRIYAAQDADLIAALAGDITGIAQIGNKFAATAVDANTISVADGVIVTKEGRRIQLDAGSTDMFVIPTGTTGVTNYYIIGYKLTTQSDDSQIAETFVQLMSSSSETITEDTFREGATDVYVSLYRVQQNGVNLGTITGLLPELTSISQLNNDLSDIETDLVDLSGYTQVGTTGVFYRKYLKFVEIWFKISNITVGNTGVTLATLPADCKPPLYVEFLAADVNNPTDPQVRITITSTGQVVALAWGGVTVSSLDGHHVYLAG
jgi:hypothetical protein